VDEIQMNRISSKIKVPFDSVKEASWSTIIGFLVVYCVYVTFINLVVFKSGILKPIEALTMGLINQTLTINIISILTFVFIIILKRGRLSFYDIGIKKNRLFSALVAIIAIWVSMQILNIIVALIVSGKPIIHSGWSKYGITRMLGSLIAQLFGNSLFEEMAFRGFLLVQISKKLRERRGNLITGIILSQLLFSLIHIPNRILNGMNISEVISSLIVVFILGILFTVVYLFTDNLFLAVGIHALVNTPLLVFDGIVGNGLILVSMIVLPIIWDRTFGRLSSNPISLTNNL